MLRFRLGKRLPFRNLTSALALGLTSAGGLAGSALVLATPATAQDYSKGFREAYSPVQELMGAEAPDWNAVKGMLPTVEAAIANEDDRNATGSLFLQVGNNLTDKQLQRRGLELMLASGKTPPEQVGQFQWFVGNLAFEAKDYDAARTALQAAQQVNYTGPDVDIGGLIAETYFAQDNNQAGVDYVLEQTKERTAAGETVPERLLLRGLQAAYEGGLSAQAADISGMLVSSYPTERNWMNALQVLADMNDFNPQQQLDLLRLMRETNSLSQRAEFVRYIEAADPRIMSNEVDDVLAAGLAAGEFSADDTYYGEVKGIVDQRKSEDQKDAPGLVTEAQGSSDPALSIEAADVAYSLDNFSQAETMYQMALDKGAPDRDTVLTRLGIAQAKQGKYAEAQATLDQVAGARAPIAQMWSLYAQTQAG